MQAEIRFVYPVAYDEGWTDGAAGRPSREDTLAGSGRRIAYRAGYEAGERNPVIGLAKPEKLA